MNNKYKQKPFLYENEYSDTMVIFIHGILEGPDQFHPFTKACIENSYSVSAILLDGHGQTGKHFASSNKCEWIRCVDKEILKYKDKYKNIILVGHSMGALLSILLYEKYIENIKSMVLISTPIKVFVKSNIIRSSIKIAIGNIKEDDILTNHAYKAFSVGRCSLSTYIKWIPRYIDLFMLIYKSRKAISKINKKTLIIHSKYDELVSKRSISILNKKLINDNKFVQLDNSGHFYYGEEDLECLLDEFRKFIL